MSELNKVVKITKNEKEILVNSATWTIFEYKIITSIFLLFGIGFSIALFFLETIHVFKHFYINEIIVIICFGYAYYYSQANKKANFSFNKETGLFTISQIGYFKKEKVQFTFEEVLNIYLKEFTIGSAKTSTSQILYLNTQRGYYKLFSFYNKNAANELLVELENFIYEKPQRDAPKRNQKLVKTFKKPSS